MNKYSELTLKHLEKEIISSQYLIDTPFTLQDLQDIANAPANMMGNKSWRPHYAGKPKLVDSGTTYAKYLERSGQTIKPPINISSFYR
jgi:hypothetical protein